MNHTQPMRNGKVKEQAEAAFQSSMTNVVNYSMRQKSSRKMWLIFNRKTWLDYRKRLENSVKSKPNSLHYYNLMQKRSLNQMNFSMLCFLNCPETNKVNGKHFICDFPPKNNYSSNITNKVLVSTIYCGGHPSAMGLQ